MSFSWSSSIEKININNIKYNKMNVFKVSFRKFVIMSAFLSGVLFLILCASNEIQRNPDSKKISAHESVGSLSPLANKIYPIKTLLKVKNVICSVNHIDRRTNVVNKDDETMIYFVTPTYPRPEQVPELIRLGHTLMHVSRIHWIIADDQPLCSKPVANVLRRTGLPFTHISSPKPYKYTTSHFPRGVANRRAALSWIRKYANKGILYFGDDDNTFDLQLFDEIRRTKKVSMFPVGLLPGDYGVSTPVVKDGKVAGFFDTWPAARTFPVDMAGFAVNIDFIKPATNMPFIEGYEEDLFLCSLDLKLEDIEPLAANCSKVLVWHTKTVKIKKVNIKINTDKLDNNSEIQGFSNLLKELVITGIAAVSSDKGAYPKIIRNHKIYSPFDL